MKKSTFLLLPTVLAVSTSARTKSPGEESSRSRATLKTKHEFVHKPAPKSAAIEFVFTVGK